jgi:hypothetical protein
MKLMVRVLNREREGCLPVLTLESTQPSRVVVDKPVRVIRNKAVPARIGSEVDFDDIRARAVRRCSRRRRLRTRLLFTHPASYSSARPHEPRTQVRGRGVTRRWAQALVSASTSSLIGASRATSGSSEEWSEELAAAPPNHSSFWSMTTPAAKAEPMRA